MLKNHKELFLISAISLAAISIFSYFSSPTVFSGRDQGSLSEAAIRLAQNRQLEFSTPASIEFFKIYGEGLALNFPGFFYTDSGQLTPQFPLGYIFWLAFFYAIFGLAGLIIANGVALFIFLLSFYLLTRQFLSFSSSLISIILVLSSFVFLWFFKFTLSENLALALIWFGIYQFALFAKNNTLKNLRFSLFSFSLLLFVRIEALFFIAAIALILFFRFKNKQEEMKNIFNRKTALIATTIAVLFVANIFIAKPFYISLAKATIRPFLSAAPSLASSNVFLPLIYVLKIFAAYSLLGFLALGLFGIFYFLKKKNYSALLPFFIVLPSFFYLFSPNISADHPWMLRRFLFAVIPVCIFYTIYFLDDILKKRAYFYLMSGLLIISNLSVAIFYLPIVPHKNLLAQTEELSRSFQKDDLILIDREASGDGWSMLTGPMNFLYGKQAVYFFNPADLEKIDRNKFTNIYLIVPDKNLSLYSQSGLLEKMQPVKNYAIENNFPESAIMEKQQAYSSPVFLPVEKNIVTKGKIYLYKP